MGKKKKKFWKTLLSIAWNKYFISLVAILVWITFFDKDDLMSQYELMQKLDQLKTEQQYYTGEIEKSKNSMNELRTNSASLEKFAREKYLMKKDNEEIFVIVKDSTGKAKPQSAGALGS
jgi:cell division protein FtsB